MLDNRFVNSHIAHPLTWTTLLFILWIFALIEHWFMCSEVIFVEFYFFISFVVFVSNPLFAQCTLTHNSFDPLKLCCFSGYNLSLPTTSLEFQKFCPKIGLSFDSSEEWNITENSIINRITVLFTWTINTLLKMNFFFKKSWENNESPEEWIAINICAKNIVQRKVIEISIVRKFMWIITIGTLITFMWNIFYAKSNSELGWEKKAIREPKTWKVPYRRELKIKKIRGNRNETKQKKRIE